MDEIITEKRYMIIPPIYNTNLIKFCYILSKKVADFLLKNDVLFGITWKHIDLLIKEEINYLLESNYFNFISTIMLMRKEEFRKILYHTVLEVIEFHIDCLKNPSEPIKFDEKKALAIGYIEDYYQEEFSFAPLSLSSN